MSDVKMFFICDRKACESCYVECKHTRNIEHAVNRHNLNGKIFECIEGYDGSIGLFERNKEEELMFTNLA